MGQPVPDHVRRWNRTRRPYPRRATLPELFAEQVRRSPHAPALRSGSTTLTYRELSDRADAFARVLRDELDVRAGRPVAFLLDRSVESVISTWAILKAGGRLCAAGPGPTRLPLAGDGRPLGRGGRPDHRPVA